LAAGAGLYTAAVASTLIILLILAGLKPFEERFRATYRTLQLRLDAHRGALSAERIEQALGGRAARIKQLVVQAGENPELDDVTLVLTHVSARETADVVRRLEGLDAVLKVREPNETGRSG
jgi:putative Mg2+ transporter-C (MgtC) family protein